MIKQNVCGVAKQNQPRIPEQSYSYNYTWEAFKQHTVALEDQTM